MYHHDFRGLLVQWVSNDYVDSIKNNWRLLRCKFKLSFSDFKPYNSSLSTFFQIQEPQAHFQNWVWFHVHITHFITLNFV